jgi:thymidylate synthase
MSNTLDKQYTSLLQDILDNGVEKKDRTGTGTLSVFGRQIRHKMSDGFPLLTTKKMHWKSIVTELLWFLRGDTNIKYLVDNNCHIWDGDAYKSFKSKQYPRSSGLNEFDMEDFIVAIKNDDYKEYNLGELGPVYGKQWRSWYTRELRFRSDVVGEPQSLPEFFEVKVPIDQIANLINDLKTNPDSRRLMVNAWNVGEVGMMVLPPCHYGFQVYTRELSEKDRKQLWLENDNLHNNYHRDEWNNLDNIPTRAISLMWNQRSVDTFLGLPFNIASYGLLLEIIAKAVNMVPDELIGNLGDTHLYSNHIEQAKEQIGRDYTLEERLNMVSQEIQNEFSSGIVNLPNFSNTPVSSDDGKMSCLDDFGIPRSTREPYPLPTLNINTEFWPTESGSCGEGPIDALAVFNSFKKDDFCKCLLEEDIQLGNYQSHSTIKAPLSN